jgi:hypothetical protein
MNVAINLDMPLQIPDKLVDFATGLLAQMSNQRSKEIRNYILATERELCCPCSRRAPVNPSERL